MNRKGLVILALLAVIVFLLMSQPKRRSGSVPGYTASAGAPAMVGRSDFDSGVVSSASLIPRDVVATEDFGQFSPDKILGNQNYLDPRSQIGYPETLGGVLRNGNQQERSEPLNPRTPVSIFNLSTIPPDVMRPRFDIDYEYA
jgi:hypothetical protein